MIDLLICCLVLLPFLTADIRPHPGDREALASETHRSTYFPCDYRDCETKERQD